MQNNLSRVFQIQKYLEDIKYPDSYRVSKEIDIFLQSNTDISQDEIQKRISNGEPWEYIKGECEFCNNIFKVNRYTLIPRIETEQIVYDCKKILQQNDICNIVDVGTGSGSILISLISLIQNPTPYSFTGTDISEKALEMAKENEKRILKSKIINWIQCDLIKGVPNLNSNTLLIANLPYIPTAMYMNLDGSVKSMNLRLL